MTKNKYRAESNRWRFWDYSSQGSYFITICVLNRHCILGRVTDKRMILSKFGNIVKSEILKIPQYHKRIILDEWVVMPNHIHLLITLGNYDFDNGMIDDNDGDGNDGDGGDGDVDKIHEFYLPTSQPPTSQPPMFQQPMFQPPTSQPPTPSQKPWWYNPHYQPTTIEIKQYRKQRRKMIIPKILGKMKMLTSKQINIARNTPGQKNWQHDYYDHVVRNQKSYQRIKNYIINNPKNWDEDKFHRD